MEFQTVRGETGRLVMTPKQWIERMCAIGIISHAGRYGGTYAHSDIAFEFASWISPQFKLYMIKDYQRLKQDEAHRLEIGWDTKRELSKINYRIHTDAVKEFHLESMNADLIRQGIPAIERVQKLRNVAYYQLQSLQHSNVSAKFKQNLQRKIEQQI